MSDSDSRHVQTELAGKEYEAFRKFAQERGMTVKEAGREALVKWVERQRRADPYDPAFIVLDELDEPSLPEPATTDARRETGPVDEWSGKDVDFTLADGPPVRSNRWRVQWRHRSGGSQPSTFARNRFATE